MRGGTRGQGKGDKRRVTTKMLTMKNMLKMIMMMMMKKKKKKKKGEGKTEGRRSETRGRMREYKE